MLQHRGVSRAPGRGIGPAAPGQTSAAEEAADRDSPYMLEAVQVRADVRDQVPAIVHMDGSARHQAAFHFTGQEADRDAIWQSWLDRGYTVEGMYLLARTPELRADQDQSTPERANMLASYRATVDPTFTGIVENFRRTRGPGAPLTHPAALTGAFGVVNPLRRS